MHRNPFQINSENLVEIPMKTTPDNVREAHEGLYHAKMNLPEAAKHCGMTEKEMKMTFWEYLKYHPPLQIEEENEETLIYTEEL